ncbi:hypothetical protein FRC14_007151 [Serendipita sp. 396]|nr:hypothetical protein FRC14_007151 [Serendipita sp. 396]KAG8786692.1 hypothetical protein FRC15_010913 [Serendipita sp. 397]KAG8802118.1 hypothetical protein FRC16_010355 [Serendipita sp. 398]KAG8825705.1 hypothetical protein FRC19_010695 [Serendipita sp. 401]KAG8835499.1 hypothetical protein FRC18_000395 [Serendipita sp. 400]KAG8857902.1 hypothetical protein FRB91_010670 [Serendipita sp. 411]KAG8871259.1 hypothetical protein FRC20_010782 [Serendipita sp. 405]KAG9056280.1 hypothetical prot
MESLVHFVNSGVIALKHVVLTKTPQDVMVADLKAASIPVSNDPCRTCADPCEAGHLEYPPRFDVDTSGDMLGSVKPYMRQVVISTGKADWVREVTDEDGSLAQLLSSVSTSSSSSPAITAPSFPPCKPTTRLGILNGSHTSSEDEAHRVLVLPDFKVITNVEPTKSSAKAFYDYALAPSIGRIGGTMEEGQSFRSYPLPYACIILLCSHRRRDNRCHIAALKLETAFCRELESRKWEVDHNLREEEEMNPPLEELTGSEQEKEEELNRRLRDAATGTDNGQKLALILKISHIGGHKYAGNVILYTPQGPNTGTGIWYGRVSPHEVPAVVQHTIIEGKILPELLRGGINVTRKEDCSLLDW